MSKGTREEQSTRQDLEKMSSKILEGKTPAMQNSWETLLSRDFSVSTTNSKYIVFDAPDRNKWFTGRQKELELLERCLSLENSDHKFRMEAISVLVDVEKRSLWLNSLESTNHNTREAYFGSPWKMKRSLKVLRMTSRYV